MRTRITTLAAALCLAATAGWAIDSIPTGPMSEGVAINPITRIAVTTNMGSVMMRDSDASSDAVVNPSDLDGSLTVIDVDARTFVRTIAVGGIPVGPAIDPENNLVVFSDKADNTVVIWSLENGGGELARIPVGQNPSCIGLDAAAQIAVLATEVDNTVWVIDLATRAVTHQIPVGVFPICMHYTINAATMTATVANVAEGTVQVLDLAGGTVVNTIAVGNAPISASTNMQTNHALVPLNADNAVAVVDLTAGTVVHTVAVGAGPACSVIDETRNIAYVSNLAEGSLSAVDMAAGTVLGTAGGLGFEPQCLAFDDATNTVLVTAHSGEVWLLDASEIIGSTFTPTAVRAGTWGQVKTAPATHSHAH